MEKTKQPVHYTKYEKARLLGSRALQISMGAPMLVDLKPEDLEKIRYNPLEIAKLEFQKGVIPIHVKKPLPKVKQTLVKEAA
ncbi:DNA-directed RNA polymerase subunit K [Candidatus Woesearchaeota archaeon]|nr:DNA-directed RNA polymerase subunit K [Candidatus Woesearchaeota archaeon]